MIRFSLHCDQAHHFEGWFRSNDDFETQRKRGFVECPECGSQKVEKALMAPSVSTSRKQAKIALAMGQEQRKAIAALKELSEKVRANAENVGDMPFRRVAQRRMFPTLQGAAGMKPAAYGFRPIFDETCRPRGFSPAAHCKVGNTLIQTDPLPD